MVEFALALPVLLLVVYGLLEAGRLLFIYASVVTSARQAARYGSATGMTASSVPYYQDCDGIRGAAKRVAFINPINDADIQITYDHGLDSLGAPRPFASPNPAFPGCWQSGLNISNGDRILVHVKARWEPIVRLVPSWTGFDITSQSNRTLLIGASIAVEAGEGGYTGNGQLSLSVTPSPETYDHAGQAITYTYTVTNTGTVAVNGPITISDTKTGDFPCSPGPLAPGNGSATCTAVYSITPADVTNGSVTNNATATAANDGTPLTASDSATILLNALPELTLSKSGVAPDIIVTNAIITYTFTLQNTGNVALTSPYIINDAKIGNRYSCAGAASPLAPQASTTCTGTYPISKQDIDSGSVVNVATATAKYGSVTVQSNEATATVITPALHLNLAASPVSISTPGEVITFTYTLRNPGDDILSAPYNITNTKSGITMNCGNLTSPLMPGASTSCTGVYTVTQADIDAGSVTNSSTATSELRHKIVNSNTASVLINAVQTARLVLTKRASVPTATTPGITINYTYTIQNTGNVTLSGPFAVKDDKIATVTCTAPAASLAPNATKTCTGSYVTTQADIDEGSVINHATATGKFMSQTVTSSEVRAIVITYLGPRLRLQKSANPPTMSKIPGQILTYTYTLKNTGGVVLTGPFSVVDDKISSVNCSAAASPLNPGDVTACTASYTTTPEDVGAGGVTNHAMASGFNAGAPQASNQATATVPVYVCSGDTLTFGPVDGTSDVTWVINNNAGTQVQVSSVSILWSNASSASLTSVLLGGNTLWSGTNNSGNFTLPGQAWSLNPGSTSLQVLFSAPATGIRGIVTISDSGCPN